MKLFIFLWLVLSFSASAAEVDLVTITNEEDLTITLMYLEIDEDQNISGFGKKTYIGDTLSSVMTYPGNLSYAGIALKRMKKMDIIILKSLNLDLRNGGALELDFLFNWMVSERKQVRLELDRTSDSWQLTKNGRIIKHLHLISNKKPFLGTVGIKEIIAR
jgi:hypothetical protein